VPAGIAGSIGLGIKEILISYRNGVRAIVAYNKPLLMEEIITFLTEPLEPIYFPLKTLAFNYK
tara:strand:+ start:301 stop:489 length:189 start_codon:yes stop_codon:yes gene_type:complete